MLYDRLRKNPNSEVTPRTFFFAGKAAPAYQLAKVIIKFINNLAEYYRRGSDRSGDGSRFCSCPTTLFRWQSG